MKYGILLEKITESGFPKGYFYAHVPTLGLTTHGKGIDGALNAARDLVSLWLEEKRDNNEVIIEIQSNSKASRNNTRRI